MNEAISSSSQACQPELEGELFAAIDLGSNSFHLVVARYQQCTLHVIDRLKEAVRLGEGVNQRGRLSAEVSERALQCLARFGERLRQVPSARLSAVGTNALRRLSDDWQFLAQAEAELGHPIEIISGEEEARLIYLGVAHGIAEDGRQRLVIDIGGGSTEFIIGHDFHPTLVDSLFFGCLSVEQQFFRTGKITRKRWQKAFTAVALELQRIANGYRKVGWEQVFGASGTLRAVRDVAVANQWCESGITPKAIAQLRQRIIAAGHVEALDLTGLSERRRTIFPSGVVIIEAIFQVLKLEHMRVADYALREGLLYNQIGRILHTDPRHAAVAALMQRYRVDDEQAQRVHRTAAALLEQVDQSWHCPPASADWLSWTAMLHEIGLTIAHHGYHRHGAYLLQNSDLPGFSRQEQGLLAAIVLNHRGKPNAGSYRQLITRLRTPALQATALLRLAVLLNRGRSATDLPALQLTAKDRNLTLSFPPLWLEQHPLTCADLSQEVSQLKALKLDLSYY